MSKTKELRRNGQKVFVVAKSVQWFWNGFRDRYKPEDVRKIVLSQGYAVLQDYTEVRYLSNPNALRGLHAVKVEIWSNPPWYEDVAAVHLVELARRP